MENKKYSVYRFIVGLNFPPIVGALIYFMLLELNSDPSVVASNPNAPMPDQLLPFRALIELIGFAYIFVGVQSIISTIIMECLVFKQTKLNQYWLGFGVLLGGLSGTTLLGFGFTMIGIGIVVGALCSFWLNQLVLKQKNSLLQPAVSEG
ncbi:hypothetical protein FLL45_22020 [Aliikangiella marina]|uniref:Uncharacterized protein n=1 Tax=Aliikangiella marina TaxID=1712262 RepID=A0A545T1A6_9GAMM|nr:hypothetical protein [Aliikangiella marina]TQV71007.1 hypothetical protein FLL45_22020 [Aliikangiella marina]